MLKILIADDETPIREWIEFCINKSVEKYEIVPLASNGVEALEIFQQTLADIAFIDIKMPIMDGMELMKQIKLLKPSTEVIVLTAYGDFEYARTAVKYGALEYILKTEINDRMIQELLMKASQKIGSQHGADDRNLNAQYLKREVFMRRMVAQSEDTVTITEKELQEQHIKLKNNFLFAMAIKYGQTNLPVAHGSDFVIPDHNRIQNVEGFIYDKNIFVLLANLVNIPSLMEQKVTLSEFARELRQNHHCTLGISNIYEGLKYVGIVVEEAVGILRQEFYNGEGGINQMTGITDNEALLKQLKAQENSLRETVEKNGIIAAEDGLDRILKFIEDHQISNIDEVKKKCSQMIDFVYKQVRGGRETGLDSFYAFNEEIARINNFQALQSYVREKISEAVGAGRKKSNSYSYTIAKAVDYINLHYVEPINLTSVARVAHLNPEYFCRLFKEETGCKFSNYLTNLRLGQAVKLLENSDYKVYEIAEMVGYSNLSYFSTLFKKYYGVSPFDFRNCNIRMKY
jgi:two-component system response regulator YesN